ncbi:MAG TPA: hypothetical protein VGQ62_22170 [Chloroflexota bacterium]|jgi:hypothetical protein|nr:hypothetical protein [Chloroflexota bacterium]
MHWGRGAILVTVLFLSGCLADPQRVQSATLFDRLSEAHAAFVAARQSEGCNTVGDVQTRLVGEPGLANGESTYRSLRAAAQALQAVCGQTTVLEQAISETAASRAARDRWQTGIQRELGIACDYLGAAAADLGRAAPC